MKKLCLLLALAGLAAGRLCAEPVTIDGYAAIVNDRVITVSDVMEYIAPAEEQLRINYTGRDLANKRVEVFSNGVQRLVEQALVLEEFKKKGGTIPDRIINDRVNEIISDRFNNNRAEFLQTLAAQKITLDEWREGIRDRMIVSMLRRQEVLDRVRITPGQVREAYERQKTRFTTEAMVRISMIVLHKGATDDAAESRRQDAIMIRGKILGGEQFAEMARKYSEDNKAADGGAWGWNKASDLRTEVQTAIAGLKQGDVSEVIDAGSDYMLVRIDERQEAGLQPFEKVRPKLEEEIKQAEADRLFAEWIERLKRKSNIQVFEATAG